MRTLKIYLTVLCMISFLCSLSATPTANAAQMLTETEKQLFLKDVDTVAKNPTNVFTIYKGMPEEDVIANLSTVPDWTYLSEPSPFGDTYHKIQRGQFKGGKYVECFSVCCVGGVVKNFVWTMGSDDEVFQKSLFKRAYENLSVAMGKSGKRYGRGLDEGIKYGETWYWKNIELGYFVADDDVRKQGYHSFSVQITWQ